jgi:hybrid cluster-associated redox disulfide protein
MKSNKKIKKRAVRLISKNMTFQEIIKKYPTSIEVLMNEGMHCIGCSMAGFETLEQGALAHGLNPDELVEKMNKLLQKNNKRKIKPKSKKKK